MKTFLEKDQRKGEDQHQNQARHDRLRNAQLELGQDLGVTQHRQTEAKYATNPSGLNELFEQAR